MRIENKYKYIDLFSTKKYYKVSKIDKINELKYSIC